MQRSHKKPAKKNLFDDDEQQNTPQTQNSQQTVQTQKPSSKKNIENASNKYEAAKISQNWMYINKKPQDNQLKAQTKLVEQNKSMKKKKQLKKKNLFDSDEDEQKQQNEDVNIQPPQKLQSTNSNLQQNNENQYAKIEPIKQSMSKQQRKNNNKSTAVIKKQQSSDEEPVQEEQQDSNEKQKIQQIKQIISEEEKKVQNDKIKQISFFQLLEKAGSDRKQIKRVIYEPIPQGYRAICLFKRVQNGFSEAYQLAVDDIDRPLLFSQNQRGCIGANYYISLTKQMDKNSSAYLGKLRGNKLGSIYNLYDAGKQPDNSTNRQQWRTSMARVQYQTNILGMNGPRKLKAVLPNASYTEDVDCFKLSEAEDLSILQPPLVINFRNKQPRWNQRLKSYALNFGGRVKQASIKNFILVMDDVTVEDEFQAPNSLIFGKIDDNTFSLQVIYPLSIYQAFGIVLSEFDFKLNCQ